jgi:hypothetical protein
VEHQPRHALKLQHHLVDDEGLDEDDHFLGDVLGEVADLFEIVADSQRADDVPQVHRHRLAPRDGDDRLLLDLALQ